MAESINSSTGTTSGETSALCPDAMRGCSHTFAMNGRGEAVACVEYADAHGIEWQACDHPDHRAEDVAPGATHHATFTWHDGQQTLRRLCDDHAKELRTLTRRGATAFGHMRDVALTRVTHRQ